EPPEHWSGNMPLSVSAHSVDGASDGTQVTRNINVQVIGVADEVDIVQILQGGELPAYSEADLDSGGRIDLTDLVQVPVPVDGDGSEVVSLLLTGLPPGFTLAGASPLNSGATGEAREWSLSLS